MSPRSWFTLPLVACLSGCTSMSSRVPRDETVEQVDLPRFMGQWYVIAHVPTFLEKNAYNAIERYTWNEREKRIDVDYTQREGAPDGKLKSYPQKAWVANPDTNAEWRVRPLWPLLFGYLIVDLAPDYSWTVVGVPAKNHLWVMARTPTMDEALLQRILERARTKGYELENLRRVPQVW